MIGPSGGAKIGTTLAIASALGIAGLMGDPINSSAFAAALTANIGANWVSDIGPPALRRLCERFGRPRTPDTGLDGDLWAALRLAFAEALDSMVAAWWKSPDGKRCLARGGDALARVRWGLEELKQGAATLGTREGFAAAFRDGDGRLIVDSGAPPTADTLRRSVLEYLGVRTTPNDPLFRPAAFVGSGLASAMAFQISVQLKQDQNARIALEGLFRRAMLAEARAAAEAHRISQEQLTTIRRDLGNWGRRLRRQSRHETERVLRALDTRTNELHDSLVDTIKQSTETILGAVSGVREEVHSLREDIKSGARPQRSWLRPEPAKPETAVIGRANDLATLKGLLTAPVSGPVVLHGLSGVGKTLLAQHAAFDLDSVFTGGVLRADIGRERPEDRVRATLADWARYAYGGGLVPDEQPLDPASVRALLSDHGPLLVFLDDVWSWPSIQPLLDALPGAAQVLVTTQHERLARARNRRGVALKPLEDDDALTLLRGLAPRIHARNAPLLDRLVTALEGHPLALTITGVSLELQASERWQGTVERIEREVREGVGEALRLGQDGPDEERDRRIEASLSVAYDDLDTSGRARFRALGAFDPIGTFGGRLAMAAWACEDEEDGWRALDDLAARGLLTRYDQEGAEPSRWHQHGVVRSFALRWLDAVSERDAAARTHAEACLALLKAVEGQEHLALPEYPQIAHAFAWAIEHDISLGQSLISRVADLQERFGLESDGYCWAEQLRAVVSQTDDADALGAAWGSVGNALSCMANRGGQDRGVCLREALAAYDQALRFYALETAPIDYAMTQINRGAALTDLATLGDEDRGARMREALDAFDQALRFHTPEIYAASQNNRGNVLLALAAFEGEDRGERLREALDAYDQALQFYTHETALLDYAMTQSNRGIVLTDLATLDDEDREARLREALDAYDQALRFYTPETAPLAYAKTQGNLANLYLYLAGAEPDRITEWMRAALTCVLEARSIFIQVEHGPYVTQAVQQVKQLRLAAGAEFPAFWREVTGSEDLPDWLADEG